MVIIGHLDGKNKGKNKLCREGTGHAELPENHDLSNETRRKFDWKRCLLYIAKIAA